MRWRARRAGQESKCVDIFTVAVAIARRGRHIVAVSDCGTCTIASTERWDAHRSDTSVEYVGFGDAWPAEAETPAFAKATDDVKTATGTKRGRDSSKGESNKAAKRTRVEAKQEMAPWEIVEEVAPPLEKSRLSVKP